MKRNSHLLAVLAMILLGGLAGAVTDDFTRYQAIVDRKPFGEPPPDPSTTPAVVVQNDSDLFATTMKMVAIKLDQKGNLRVGFLNMAAGNKSYYLNVGETSPDGIELVEADFEREAALLRKDSRSGWIFMGTKHDSPAVKAMKQLSAMSSQLSSPEALEAIDRKREALVAEGLRKRKEFREVKKANYAAILSAKTSLSGRVNGEQLEKELKESQMDAIRKGLPALPLPLTKEMDDQLVAEGVLQPQQGAK